MNSGRWSMAQKFIVTFAHCSVVTMWPRRVWAACLPRAPGMCRGGWGQLASPPLFPSFSVLALSLSVFSFSFDFLYIFLSLARRQDNSLYLVVLVGFIWYPSKMCVTFLQSEYAQDRTIWGTVSHFEDAGGRHTCSQSLTGAFVYPEMICRC